MQARLDAEFADVDEFAADNFLVVDGGAVPAAGVGREGVVEDVVGAGFEVDLGEDEGALGVAGAVDGVGPVGDARDVDHGVVDAFDPVETWGVG